jgi:hypothetical protein
LEEGKPGFGGITMGRDTTNRDKGGRPHRKRQGGLRRIDDVLNELLAQWSLRSPQLKIVVVTRDPGRRPRPR